MRIMIFNVDILLSRLGSFMICTHDVYVLTKRKNIMLLQIVQIRGQGALDKRYYCSNEISVPAEKWIKHLRHGLFTNILI
jgi:hypothetical protein